MINLHVWIIATFNFGQLTSMLGFIDQVLGRLNGTGKGGGPGLEAQGSIYTTSMLRFIDQVLNRFNRTGKGRGPLLRSLGPPYQAPRGRASTPHYIPTNVLAFRTITSILAQLQRSRPIETIDNLQDKSVDLDYRREIRICDAFALLAAGGQEVVALATNGRIPFAKQLCVMACIEDYAPPCENSPTSAQPQNLFGLWYQMLSKFLPLGDVETSSQIPHPTIISPSEPDGLQGRSAFDYMKGLENHW